MYLVNSDQEKLSDQLDRSDEGVNDLSEELGNSIDKSSS